MKKLLFFAASILVLALAGCKVETSKVTVSVRDTNGNPIEGRRVYYDDLASSILDILAPDPEAPLTGSDERNLEFGVTNAQGVVTFSFNMSISNLNYYFYVFDKGSNQWHEKSLLVKRGYNSEVEFEVNK